MLTNKNNKRPAESLSSESSSCEMEENARDRIEQILLTTNAQGSYYSHGSAPSGGDAPMLTLKNEGNSKPISFPLSEEDMDRIKAEAEHAPVGTKDSEEVVLKVRTTWQLLPNRIQVTGLEAYLDKILPRVARDLGIKGTIEANLYKFLLYEKGCFFRRHRDNERLPRMFGTLVLEMPSSGYEGAELKVWSPTCSRDVQTFNMCHESKAQFAAFYADCFHEVTDLMSGHRAAFIFSLCMKKGKIPPQPADASVAQAMADEMVQFAKEEDDDYDPAHLGKPKKLALVLSHSYTKAGLAEEGISALKGTDRAVAELVLAAMKTPPSTTGNTPGSKDDGAPFFDAVISLAEVWNSDEGAPKEGAWDDRNGFQTVGPHVPLMEGATISKEMLGPLKTTHNIQADHSSHDIPILRHELLIPNYTSGSRYYYSQTKEEFRQGTKYARTGGKDEGNCNVLDSAEEIEFLGNGAPPMGRIYSTAVILVWPKANRQAVALQTEGGQEVYNSKK